MMKHTHTPGPWTTQTYTPGFDQDGYPFESHLRVITRTCEVASGIQCEEDARLISAAPELLDALRELVQYVRDEFSCSHPLHEAAERANAAILRATGGQT